MEKGRQMWAREVLAWLCCAWIAVLVPVPAAADANDEARILFEAGVTASRSGRWREASEYFQRSLSLAEKPSTWFNLAVAEVKLGHGREALRSLDAFEQMANPSDHGEMLARATQLRAEAQALLANEPEPVPEPAGDDEPSEPPAREPASAEPAYPVSARPPERPPSSAEADLRAPRRMLIAGVGLALATTGTLVWWSNRADARDRCEQDAARCTNTERLEREERTALGVSVALGTISAGLIAAGATWLAWEKRQAEKTTAQVMLGQKAASLALRVRF